MFCVFADEVFEGSGSGGRGSGGLVKYYFPAGYVFVQMSPILICLFVIPSSTEGPKARLRVSGYN